MSWISIISISIGVVIFLSMLYVAIVSYFEKEKRSLGISLFLSLLLPLPYLAAGLLGFEYSNLFSCILFALTFAIVFLLFLPVRRRPIQDNEVPSGRVDERETIFARVNLNEGTERFNEFYKNNPHFKVLDDGFRQKPGLLSPESKLYNPVTFESANASFYTLESLLDAVDGEVADKRTDLEPEYITEYIKKWAKKLGALDVGVTELKDYHLYSHRGRTEPYGEPIEKTHEYAVAFTVEMERDMIRCAPEGPTIMESAQMYLEAGSIAIQVAAFIRNLGYSARAHIDENYHVICPLVARDAGLGEIGRIGLLMTPKYGPRVRISVVTTSIPLVTDKRKRGDSVIDFCMYCSKCANTCPVEAIPFGDREENNGVNRWCINREACYTFWCQTGTDCARCISVCPYSHPNNLFHNIIRFGIRNSYVFRRLAVILDDLFYGKKPPPLQIM